MNIASHPRTPASPRHLPLFALALLLSAAFAQAALAEEVKTTEVKTTADSSSSAATLSLPDAPSAISNLPAPYSPAPYSFDQGTHSASARPEATRTTKYIEPGQLAPSITASNKFLLGVKDALSPLSIVGWVSAAGYAQVTDASPNYGTDRGAFGQRLGAAAIRATTENILGDSIMSPLFHEDPRYYRMGRGHNVLHRVVYAGTRALITRTDSGRSTPNLGQLSGNLEGSILTNVYYPSRNRSVQQTAETFAGSVGGSALGFVVSEFINETLQAVHLQKSE